VDNNLIDVEGEPSDESKPELHQHNHNTFEKEKKSAEMVYTIVVHLYAKPEAEAIAKLKAKLVEASTVYSQDKETLSWFVMQDVSDERKFTIVERYLKESVCPYLSKTPHVPFSKRNYPRNMCGCSWSAGVIEVYGMMGADAI
jgi:quinol monooxygenase YgiN